MFIKKLLSVDDAKSNKDEKKYITFLLLISLIISLSTNIFITYSSFIGIALTHLDFYKAVFNGVLFLCMLPFVIAYLIGSFLNLISYLLKNDKTYSTQYSLVVMLFVFFSYFFVIEAVGERDALKFIESNCMVSLANNKHDENIPAEKQQEYCHSLAISVFPKLRYCVMSKLSKRADCILNVLEQHK